VDGSQLTNLPGGGGGSGTVTSVAQSFTGGLISVAGSPITASGTLALTVAGTSGGIPYFSSGTTWATSAALAASALVVGGGAGAAPATVTTGANVLTALGVAVGSAGAFITFNGPAGTPSALVGTNISGTAASLTAGNATLAATVTVANEATDTTCFPLFATAATGSLAAFTNAGLTFDASIGLLSATGLAGALNGTVGATTPASIAGTTGTFNDAVSTSGANATISTSGSDASLYTTGADAHIYTTGANATIQTRTTFRLSNGTYTTTLSHAPSADRAIALPNAAGTLALTTDITGGTLAGSFTTLTASSTTSLLLGTAGSAVGTIGFRNATSGTTTLAPAAGALGTGTVTLPLTGTLATLEGANTFTGVNTFTPAARTSGSASFLTITTPADTTLTASTESIGVNKTAATRQFATGALTTQREVVFAAPTYGFVGASTLTTAVNVDIENPVAGTNGTLTNKYALRAGATRLTGVLTLENTIFSTNGYSTINLNNSNGGIHFSVSGSMSTGWQLSGGSFQTLSGLATASTIQCANAVFSGTLAVTGATTQGGAAAAATTATRLTKLTSSIADNTATAVLTVTIPNAAHAASLRVRLLGRLGAGGAIGADEANGTVAYDFSISRTAGVNAVVTASTAFGSATSSVAGAATVTVTAAASAISGAVGASNTFTVNVTIAKGSGGSANHTCTVLAEVINANATGITIA
jgi:hypothetical protein